MVLDGIRNTIMLCKNDWFRLDYNPAIEFHLIAHGDNSVYFSGQDPAVKNLGEPGKSYLEYYNISEEELKEDEVLEANGPNENPTPTPASMDTQQPHEEGA